MGDYMNPQPCHITDGPADDWPGDASEDFMSYARERAKDRLFRPDYLPILVDALCDDFPNALGGDWGIWNEAASKRDTQEMGSLMLDALDRLADQYLESWAGQMLIEDIAEELAEE